MNPPRETAEFLLNMQFCIFGLLSVQEMAPPSIAEFQANVQLISVGLWVVLFLSPRVNSGGIIWGSIDEKQP